jgi:hypothetical protein
VRVNDGTPKAEEECEERKNFLSMTRARP